MSEADRFSKTLNAGARLTVNGRRLQRIGLALRTSSSGSGLTLPLSNR
jgi:hypothetical protein